MRGGAWGMNVEGGGEVEELLGGWAREVMQGAVVIEGEWEGAGAGGSEVEAEKSGMWGSEETGASPPLRAREPLASTSRENQLLDPSPELAAPVSQSTPLGPPPVPSHTTLAPATLSPPTLAPCSLLTPASIGSRTRPTTHATAAQPAALAPTLATATRPPAETRDRRTALTRKLQRSLKGRLGPGGLVIPFKEGDERLEGRACLGRAGKRARVDENGWGGSSGGREEEETWGSFRTVPPTPEQLRRK